MDLPTTLIGFINDGILASKSKSTLNRYQYAISILFYYLKTNFIPLEVSSLSKQNMEGFFVWGIQERKWKRITHWTYHLKVNAYLNWMVKKRILEINPLAEIPKPKLPPQYPKGLNEQELIELLQAVVALPSVYKFAKVRNKAIIATFIFTGLRKSELLNLKVSDVDLDNNFIFVLNGKGNKSREIPIEQNILKPVLVEYVKERSRLGKADNFFFNGQWCGSRENNYLGYTVLDRLFRELSKAMKKRIHAHQLRHSFATMLLDKTGDLYTLSNLLGHSNIQTTTIYLNLTRSRKVDAIASLNLLPDKH